MELAQRSQVSLPTIQNIEANRANPSLETLLALSTQLGLEFHLTPKPVDWDKLAFYGVPLTGGISKKLSEALAGSPFNQMTPCLKAACIELHSRPDLPDRPRKLEAIQAFLFALFSHYPALFKNDLSHTQSVTRLMPTTISGKLIKLRRIALARLGDYL